MTAISAPAITPGRQGLMGRLSDLFWRRPNLRLVLMLVPPLLWLGIIYVGSLFALLLQSFFSIDEFSGLINYEFTLATYGELLRPANFDIILRTLLMSALVTLVCAVIAFPIAYFAARFARGRWKAVFYLGVMLPLWSSYLVKVYAWKLILAKEGIITWAAEATHTSAILNALLSLPVIGGNSLLGGRFSIAASVIGALIIQTISSGIRLAGFPSEYNLVIKAVLVLVILVLQSPRIAREWAFWREELRQRREMKGAGQ